MEQQTLQLQTIRLYGVWLDFLNHAGKYAARYYMARDLELPPGEQNPNTRVAMIKSYKTEEKLNGTIQRDLDSFPNELRAINSAQVACGLNAFPDNTDYFAQITMGFTMLDRNGKKRREYYRRKVNRALKSLRVGEQVAPQSLNQLEAEFQQSQQRSAARKAKSTS